MTKFYQKHEGGHMLQISYDNDVNPQFPVHISSIVAGVSRGLAQKQRSPRTFATFNQKVSN